MPPLSHLRIRGNPLKTPVRNPGSELDMLEDGSWEALEYFSVAWSEVAKQAPVRNKTAHPDFPTLICTRCKITRTSPATAQLAVTYRGLLGDTAPDPVEELIVSTSQDPIETSPKFLLIAGTPDAPLNDAKFDDHGLFIGFGTSGDQGDGGNYGGAPTSRYAGQTSYLVPGTTYRLTVLLPSRPTSIRGVGKIAPLPTPIDLPNQFMNWLWTSLTWKREGGVYIAVSDFQLSGPKGWDPITYGQ